MLHRLTVELTAAERQTLCNDIVQLSQTTPTQRSFNRGGWRSSGDWLATVPWLSARIFTAFMRVVPKAPVKYQGWCVVNPAGAFHARHAHDGIWGWSGVLYLDAGGGNAATVFDWEAGRGGPLVVERIEPEPGLLVVFPSKIAHAVEEHKGPRPRITVAIDVNARV